MDRELIEAVKLLLQNRDSKTCRQTDLLRLQAVVARYTPKMVEAVTLTLRSLEILQTQILGVANALDGDEESKKQVQKMYADKALLPAVYEIVMNLIKGGRL